MNRIYPSHVPSFEHEPDSTKIGILDAIQYGQGIVALTDIKKDEIVFKFTGYVLPHQTLFTLQIRPGQYIEDPYVMGKVLHSCDPNMICDMTTLTFTARRDINSGEYLTMDYETTEDKLFRSFTCACGSDNCRGEIKGKSFR